MDWPTYYPAFVQPDEPKLSEDAPEEATSVRRLRKDVEVADIGCGFGGLTVALAPVMPDTLILGECPGTVSYGKPRA